MRHWNAERAGTAIFGAGLAALGMFIGIETTSMPAGPAYAAVGPRAFPGMIGVGLVFVGLLHIRLALKGTAGDSQEAAYDWSAMSWIAGTLAAQILLLRWVGWIPAATLVFMGVARGFGSRRPVRDALIGAVLAAGTFTLFNYALGLDLPVGLWLESVIKR